MKVFEARASIAAAPQAVWAALVDAGSWPTWDSGVLKVDGMVAPGAKVTVVSAVNPGRSFPVTVTELTPPRTMRWAGGMPMGLFIGERTYTLTARADGGTDVLMREEYRGPLAGMITRSIPDLGPSFVQFVNGLKVRVETGG